jgi:NADPH:quinone reductase-like Zn-dependent oxidoreductase
MKVLITEFFDESTVAIVEGDLPDPGAGEVQLTVEYSNVSGSDVNMRRTYPFQKKAPLIFGDSVLGKVRLNGKGCSKFKVGDRVDGGFPRNSLLFTTGFRGTMASTKGESRSDDAGRHTLVQR